MPTNSVAKSNARSKSKQSKSNQSTVLRAATQVSAALAHTLEPCFGPLGVDRVLVSPTNSILVTSSGSDVLGRIQFSFEHPLGSYLLTRLLEFDDRVGDGVTGATLALSSMLRELDHLLSLNPAVSHVLLSGVFSDACQRVCWPRLVHAEGSRSVSLVPGNPELWSEVAQLLSGVFNSTFKGEVVNCLVCVMVSWIKAAVHLACGGPSPPSPRVVAQVVEEMAQSRTFQQSVLLCEGASMRQSQLLPDDVCVISRAPLQRLKGKGRPAMPMRGGRFIVMRAGIHPYPSQKQGLSLQVETKESLSFAMSYVDAFQRDFVAFLKSLGVTLLLSSEEISDVANEACLQSQITPIQCVDPEELEHLCAQTGASMVHSPKDFQTDNDSLAREGLGVYRSAREIRMNGASMTELSGLSLKPVLGVSASAKRQVLVCGPTLGICKQYRKLMHRALKALHVACPTSDNTCQSNSSLSVGCGLLAEAELLRFINSDAFYRVFEDHSLQVVRVCAQVLNAGYRDVTRALTAKTRTFNDLNNTPALRSRESLFVKQEQLQLVCGIVAQLLKVDTVVRVPGGGVGVDDIVG